MDQKTITREAVVENTPCFHCGAACVGVVRHFEEKAFCCDGCSTVYQILNESGLEAYYNLNAHPGTKSATGRYAFLDQEAVTNQFLDFQEGNHARITLQIPAIHCTSCIWLLEHLYQVQTGVLRSEVNFPKKEAYIHFDQEVISLRSLVELLDRLGYPPHLSLESLEGGRKPRIDRRIIYQLGVAGFCFGNIMLLSFPEYIGLADATFAHFFGLLNLLLALPVVGYSAADYFRAAWQGLRQGRINMDVPIALGIAVLFLRSSYDILSGTGAGYIDSMAGLVFFLLIGKFYQSKTHALLAFDRDYKSYFPIAVTRLWEDVEEDIPLSGLAVGDRLRIRNGEMIPADAVLYAGEAFLDYSFVSGEADLVPKQAGDLLYAGGRQAGGAIEIELVREVSQSYLTQLWRDPSFAKEGDSSVTALANRTGRIFTYAILAVALVTGIVWLFLDPSRALLIVSAVLIVACPCALALATPFTLGNALRILSRNGLFLKGPAVVERLAAVDTLVFDKTGTLTLSGAADVRYKGLPLAEDDATRLRTLLRQSTHPLSRQLLAAMPGDAGMEVADFAEIPGRGMSAMIGGKLVKLGSAGFLGELEIENRPERGSRVSQKESMDFAKQNDPSQLRIENWKNDNSTPPQLSPGSVVHASIDGQYFGVYHLGNVYRTGLGEVLAELAVGQELALLSGDTAGEQPRLQADFPQFQSMEFRQSPQDKLDEIRRRQEAGASVLMLGDGLNDAGALRESTVGIAVADDIAAFTPASDAILDAAAFNKLPRFLKFSRSAIRLVKLSFGLSLLYNLVGLAFAVTGHLSPLVAAILMPASSVSIILFTTIMANLIAWKEKL